ncbi:uncharacterized protein LOC130743065 isoform X2 [Lotus japonicus]|uniref:uncharacterized protein LOC130743065 isoform X2 n=1 Tax=Lotus japonicus TaxID=34305 RepID=UPI0025835625|nr:uncharacterized protein LOC130743065 isoform X2 [Lotus japonicus]
MEIMFRLEEHNGCHQNQFFSDYDRKNREHSITMTPCSASSPSPPTLPYMQHPITKLDTLPGIAIKYGVEVADIKKLNGLVTDHQMFALKMLHIPLHARHPPSTYLPDDSSTKGELVEPFQSLRLKSSPAMTRLQSYNVTKLTMKKSTSEIFDKAEYREGAPNSSENGSFYRHSPTSKRHLSHLHKSKSLASGILDEIFERCDIEPVVVEDSNTWNDAKLVSKKDNRNNGRLSSRTGSGLALRQKSGSRIALKSDCESGGLNPRPINMRAVLLMDGECGGGVRRSSSTSSLHIQRSSSSRSSLKPDLQAFSTGGTAKPTFGVLPITSRRNKAALD